MPRNRAQIDAGRGHGCAIVGGIDWLAMEVSEVAAAPQSEGGLCAVVSLGGFAYCQRCWPAAPLWGKGGIAGVGACV